MESVQNGHGEATSQQLWERLRKGKKQALGKIFKRNFDALYSYGYRIIPNNDRVRDAIQEVFFQLWKYRENLKEVKSVRAYLFVSFKRKLLNSKEVRLRREEMNEKYMMEEFQDIFNYEKWFDILEIEEGKRDDLEQALDELSARQREAVYLKYYEGLSTKELSNVMGIRAQSIYNLLTEAMKSLRVYLD